MSKNNKFWDKVFDKLDDRYINEATEKINRSIPEERELHEIIIEKPEKEIFNWRIPATIAAAVVLLVGGVYLGGKFVEINSSGSVPQNITTQSEPDVTVPYTAIVSNPDDKHNYTVEESIPTDKSLYALNFQIFYDSFRGIWGLDSDGVYYNPDEAVTSIYVANPIEEINIGWNDNLFSYNINDLIGFYKTDDASYMMGEEIICAVLNDEPDTMYLYPIYYNSVSYELSGEWVRYKKTAEGDVSSFTSMYGRLGFLELCDCYGIDPESLFDVVVEDKDGNHWTRPKDKFTVFPDVGVSKRNHDEVMFHIELTCSETGEKDYFSFLYKKEENGTYSMADEHYPYDQFILSVDEFSTELSQWIDEDIKKRAEEIENYVLVIEADFYPCPDGSYYAVRKMGSNQQQWLSDFEVLYNDGDGFTECIVVSDEYTTFMGTVICGAEDDRFYIVYADSYEAERKVMVDCIVNGEVISTYELPNITDDFTVSSLNVSENHVTVNYEIFKATGVEEWCARLDYSDIYAPVLLDFSCKTSAEDMPEEPLEGYTLISEIGTLLSSNSFTPSDMSMPTDKMYEITADKAEKIACVGDEMIVLTLDENNEFSFSFNDRPYISIIPDNSAEYSDETGELVQIGYIKNNFATAFYYENIPPEGINLEFVPPESGEYRFYILNCSGSVQNYKFIGIAIE